MVLNNRFNRKLNKVVHCMAVGAQFPFVHFKVFCWLITVHYMTIILASFYNTRWRVPLITFSKGTTSKLAGFVFTLSFMLSAKQEAVNTNFLKSLVWSDPESNFGSTGSETNVLPIGQQPELTTHKRVWIIDPMHNASTVFPWLEDEYEAVYLNRKGVNYFQLGKDSFSVFSSKT